MADKKIFLNSGATKVDLPKSTFDKSFTNHLTARFGRLYPVLVEEAVPGSSYTIKPEMAFDLMPMAFPLQSRMRCHLSFFKVPFRILDKHYKDFFSRVGNHRMPYINRSEQWVTTGSLADYMGLPTAVSSLVSRSVNLDFSKSNFTSNLRSSPFSFPFLSSYHDHYRDDDLFVNYPVSSGSSFIGVLSERVLHSLSSDKLNFAVLSTSQNPSFSAATFDLNLFAFVKRRGGSTGVLYKFIGNRNESFPNVVSSSLVAGSYTLVNQRSYNNRSTNGSVFLNHFQFQLGSSDVAAFNSFVDSDDYEVYFLLQYLSSASPYFGVSFSFQGSSSSLNIIPSFADVEDKITSIQSLILSSGIRLGFVYDSSVGDVESSRTYFQSVDGLPPKLPINALPFRAYEFIYNRFFRNVQVDPFYKNGEPTYNEYLTNDEDEADSTTPVDFFNMPYEYDQFTTALLSPQSGFAPLIGVTTNDEDNTGVLDVAPLDPDTGLPDYDNAYKLAVSLGDGGNITGISNYDDVKNQSYAFRLSQMIDFGISINDLRNVSAFQRLKEKIQKAGYQYPEVAKEFFGTTPPIGEEYPEYLGGITREIMIGKIQNTAKSDDFALGEFAGVGGVSGKGGKIKCYCAEQSYIMGVMWFSVTPIYSQMLPKHFMKFDIADYFNPVFNAIGPQPVLCNEIAPLQLDEEDLFKVFGYQRPWYDYVSRVDECHGAFRGNMRNYLLQRVFLEAPELIERFINIHADELTDVFSYAEDSDKFFGFVRFDMKCKSPVARISVPKIIG